MGDSLSEVRYQIVIITPFVLLYPIQIVQMTVLNAVYESAYNSSRHLILCFTLHAAEQR